MSLGRRAADTGNGASVVVTGEAGIGKSRLFDEVIDATGLPSVWVEAEAFQSTTPYAAVRSVLRPLLGIRRRRRTSPRSSTGCGHWRSSPTRRSVCLPLAGLALGVELASTPEVEEISPNFLRDALHREVLALLAATQPSPLIVVFDDAHLADDASLDLLAALVAFTHQHPWLLCIGHRDDWCPAGAELMALAPLTDADAAQLTDSLVGDVLSAYDRRALEDRGGGNPLFLSELARTARESGSAEDLPESIESLLMARIDQLAVPDRMLLRDASVLGTKFDPAFLASVLDDASIAAPERWVPLEAFVEPDEGAELRFVHALACEAAYEGLPFRRRRTVHGRIGMELEAHPQSAERHAGPMAMHFAAAGDHERGWRYGVLAGDQAKAAFANGDAAVSYARALREAAALPHVDPAAVAAVEERFGDVCDMEGRFDDAATAYRRARRRVGSTRLTRKIGLMHEHLGDYERAIKAQQRAIDELRHATESDEIVERAYALATYAGIRHRQGRLNEALEYGVKAADRSAAGRRSAGARPLDVAARAGDEPAQLRRQVGRAVPGRGRPERRGRCPQQPRDGGLLPRRLGDVGAGVRGRQRALRPHRRRRGRGDRHQQHRRDPLRSGALRRGAATLRRRRPRLPRSELPRRHERGRQQHRPRPRSRRRPRTRAGDGRRGARAVPLARRAAPT